MMNKIIPETILGMGILQRDKEWFLLVNGFLYSQLSLRETVYIFHRVKFQPLTYRLEEVSDNNISL